VAIEQPQDSQTIDVIDGRAAQQLLAQVAEYLSDVVLGVKLDGSLCYVNPAVEPLLGYSPQVFQRLYNQALEYQVLSCNDDQRFAVLQHYLQRQLASMAAEPVAATVGETDASLAMSKISAGAETLQMTHRDGFRVALQLQVLRPMTWGDEPEGLICIGYDASARKQNAEAVGLAVKVFENSLTAIYVTNTQGVIVQVNQAFERLTGYSAAEVIGKSPQLMDVDRYTQAYFHTINEQLERKDFWEGELQHRRKDGHVFPAWVAMSVLRDAQHKVVHTISYFSDITEKKHSDTQIHRLAYFDALTGLPNRTLFVDRMAQELRRAQRRERLVALVLLDLDQLKEINEGYGHGLGDSLVQQVGQRLLDCVRHEDTVARLGGDEFGVLVSGFADRQQAVTTMAQLTEKICQWLSQPFVIGQRRLLVGVCAGVVVFPADGSEVETLLHNADVALYHAKQDGQRPYRFYNKGMNAQAIDSLQLERELKEALTEQQFELFFQPIYAAADDGKICAMEALVRWHHPLKGVLPSAAFLPVATAMRLIRPLGDWVLRQACQQWLAWQQQGAAVGRIAVNVSRVQFEDGHLLRSLRELMAELDMPAGALELELTEATLASDFPRLSQALEEIRKLGVSVSLDDFGVGHLSLQQLKRLPLDNLKVSSSFIRGLPARDDQRALKAVVALGQSLALKVIADGVETQAQLELVQQLGCDEVQGNFLGQPLRASEFSLKP
jgi:diguanylate cyclase (GGDEF)-like protein/PAS domain S-box-containing protein